MKTVKSARILAVILALSMVLSMMIIFTVSGSAQASSSVYTLEVSELDLFPVSGRDDGEYEKCGTDNYFTAFYSEKAKIELNEKSFSDGVYADKRIAFGAKTEVGDEIINAIKIKTNGSAVVKLWWVVGDNGRVPAIYNASGTVVTKVTGLTTVKNDMHISELTIPSAGTYYIGNVGGSNYFYQIQVSDSNDGGAAAPRADWASVNAPVISSAADNGTGKIVVNVSANIGHNGGDELLVHMYKDGQLIKTKGSVTEKESHTISFTPSDSGTYTFKAELVRAGAQSKNASDVNAGFVYPLGMPIIRSATSKGDGKIELVWSSVHEAESYDVYMGSEKIATVDAGQLSYTVSGLTIGEKYSFTVSAIRGQDSKHSPVASAKATAEEQRAWGFTAYGPSTNEAGNGYVGNLNEDGKITVYSEGNKGKIQPKSLDGLAFYYTAIPTQYNFTFRAKVTVDSWTYSNGREGFGIMVADALGENGDKVGVWNNQIMAVATKIEYKAEDDGEGNVIITDTSGLGTKYTMKLGIGTIAKTGVTHENVADFEKGNSDLIAQYSTMRALDITACQITSLPGTYNIIGNYEGSTPEGTFDEHFLVTEFYLEIQKNNSGYYVSYYDANGNLIRTEKHYGADELNQLDSENVYAGFFASRNARATFSDVTLTTILAEEDAPAEIPPTTYITPTITIASGSVTTSSAYTLLVNPNVEGTITVKYLGKVATDVRGNPMQDIKLEANERFRFDLYLANYEENRIDIEFTPNPYQILPEFTELSSTRTIYEVLTVMYNRGNYHRKTIYVSPDVLPYSQLGTGSKENPFDIYTAVQNACPGQTIILMEGTYKMVSALKIERGMNGTAENPIRMIADPEAKTRPVLDFQKLYSGFTHGGNYWYFYGFDVTGSVNMQKGFQVSGHYNVLDQIHAYENGNTGIQICRLSGSDKFEDWPSYNLILNCTSYRNYDSGMEDADGFAAKLTVGEGNVFDGCVAYNNADDGWDLYAKMETGPIGSVTIRNSIAFENGFVPGVEGQGNGNGFKMGGESISGHHVLENSIAFNNLMKGIDSNSCPDIIVRNSISFNNGAYNVALYTNSAKDTDFEATGVISFRTTALDQGENLKGKGEQVVLKYVNDTTYYWDAATRTSKNSLGVQITADMFVSLVYNGWERNADGTINLKGFLEINSNAPANAANCKLGGQASYEITLKPDEAHNYSDSWYNIEREGHWHACTCGDKADIAVHTFTWIIDKLPEGNQNGKKHEECTICGYKKPSITIYPGEIIDNGGNENECNDANEPDGLSAGAIVAIVVGAVAVLGGGGFAVYWFVIRKKVSTPGAAPEADVEENFEETSEEKNESKE